ncbi:hypothetical protein [Thermoactinospora rubra]|uniref:hypothetical protein n=1 Tax=Thermoactinospora rubra TaxID=1088767 RepID=UPI000A10F757|nr:hypothetical protein [Thermoactinospora rubra]
MSIDKLARVRDEDLRGAASGAGARALLNAVVAEEPAPERRRPRRVVRWVAVAAVATAVAVAAPIVIGHEPTSYANSAMEIVREGDHWVGRITDPYANPERFAEVFRAVGLDVRLELAPSSPRSIGRVFQTGGAHTPEGGFTYVGTDPENCDALEPGCAMVVKLPVDTSGRFFVKMGRPAKPGEDYQDHADATRKGGQLEGLRVDEKTVGEVLPEIRGRGLEVVFQIIDPNPDGDGFGVDPGKQSTPVGDHWIVWDAEEARKGAVRLLVSEHRLDKNPVYGGPKPQDSGD